MRNWGDIHVVHIFDSPLLFSAASERTPVPFTDGGRGERWGWVPNKSFIRLNLCIQIKFGKHSVSDSINHRSHVMSNTSPRKKFLNWLASSLVERLIFDHENMISIPGRTEVTNIILPVRSPIEVQQWPSPACICVA